MHKPVGPCALPPTEAVGEKSCWACLTTIPAAAQVCFACGTRIEGIQCQACMAFCPEGAHLCRCSGSPFNREQQNPVLSESLLIEADAVATLLLQFSLNPQRVLVESEQMTLTSFSFFGFAANPEQLPWEKVAGYSHRSGLFLDSITIETRGQTSAVIQCLSKRSARKLKGVLQDIDRF